MSDMNNETTEVNAADCYDIICNVDSIINLPNGWELSFTESGSKKYEEKKDQRSCTVAVLGNANKGKSFILQKLAGDRFPSGFAVKTEGLSLKYPKYDNLNFILEDTAGVETPLIETDYYNLTADLEKALNNLENKNKKDEDEEDNKQENEEERINELKAKLITNYARDKTITEYFLQSFVTNNSNVLILVMNAMTYSDQILLNKIKRHCPKGKKFFVVHNLQNFDKISDCENYIEETLMKSLTFKLSKLPIVSFEKEDTTKQKNKYFYREEVQEKEDEKEDDQLNVNHLIMAYDGKDSEAGEYYNDVCITFIRNQIITESNIKAFDAKSEIRKYFISRANEFIENEISESNLKEEERSLKLVGDNDEPIEIKLKKCMVDELGDANFQGSKFTPPHRIYKTEDKKFFVIEIEVAGDKTIKTECKTVGSNYKFYITGTKKVDLKKTKEMEQISWKRDKGSFVLAFDMQMQDLPLKSRKVKKIDNENGIVSLYYELNEEENDSD